MRFARTAVTTFALAGLAACHSSPGSVAGAITASAEAQAMGVGSYVIGADSVKLFSVDNQELGTLTLSAPSADMLLVKIAYLSNELYENEVTRPNADGSFNAPVLQDRDGSIQADPALGSFFGAKQLRFNMVQLDRPSANLSPQAIASCSDYIPFDSACDRYGMACPTTQDYWSNGVHITQVTAHAKCTPDPQWGCSDACFSFDEVAKQHTCNDPGSCSNHALGFQNCYWDYCGPNQEQCCGGGVCSDPGQVCQPI